jgi:hypothetical protein
MLYSLSHICVSLSLCNHPGINSAEHLYAVYHIQFESCPQGHLICSKLYDIYINTSVSERREIYQVLYNFIKLRIQYCSPSEIDFLDSFVELLHLGQINENNIV